MGDLVSCKSVLAKNVDPSREDYLYLCVPPDWRMRIIPCRPKGEPRRTTSAEWEYEEKDGRLHLTPSLLCTDTQFHTEYHWQTDYEVKPDGVGGYDRFYAINPNIPSP